MIYITFLFHIPLILSLSGECIVRSQRGPLENSSQAILPHKEPAEMCNGKIGTVETIRFTRFRRCFGAACGIDSRCFIQCKSWLSDTSPQLLNMNKASLNNM